MLAGNNPEFLDFVWNVLSNGKNTDKELANIDNIIKRANLAKEKVIFYGDDTWFKLFYEKDFVRTEPTNSLFINVFLIFQIFDRILLLSIIMSLEI